MNEREKWNQRFAAAAPGFLPHPIVTELRPRIAPGARVLELASGPSGSALALAAAGADVTAVDISDVALTRLATAAAQRGLHVTVANHDLSAWTPPAAAFALVFATRFWDAAVFARAAAAVAPGGTLAWETFTLAEQRYRPSFAPEFCLQAGEPASLLPAGWVVEVLRELDDGASATRRLIARRT